VLQRWLASYRPTELFDADGQPTAAVSVALAAPPSPQFPALEPARGCVQACAAAARVAAGAGFSKAISDVLQHHAIAGGFRLFSPDELASNRISLPDPMGQTPPWVVEVLNEEVCHAWAQGYLETGRRSVVATYEAFAPIVSSLLAQHLKYRRLARRARRPAMPSIVYLVTSLGWNNSYSHQNPGLASMLLAAEDPSVHLHTPADAPRAAASLTFALREPGRCTIVVASKHPVPENPPVWRSGPT
jgi:xylulose-5-phosphate/fructose-6-phosphate phosphoketolase